MGRAGWPTAGLAALALALVAALALGGPAEGKKKRAKKKSAPVLTRSASDTGTGAGTILTATATCPAKTRATGGGFSVDPLPSPGGFAAVTESVKVGQRSWRASAQVMDDDPPPDAVTLTALVYCRRGAAKTSTVSTTIPTPAATQFLEATATCPSGRALLAGGFSTPPPHGAGPPKNVVLDSYPGGRSPWRVRVFALPSGPSSVTAQAYCAKVKAPRRAEAAGESVDDPGQLATATASCPGKRVMSAGGFRTTGDQLNSVLIPSESQRVAGRGWRVSGVQTGTPTAMRMTAVGVCLQR